MNIVYHVENLVKYYPEQTTPANDHLNLDVYEGEIFGMLGDNGSGKTTLVRQMVNLLESTSGHITLYGRPLTQDPLLVPRNVGYMPQFAFALNEIKVADAIYYTAHLRGLSQKDAEQEKERLLALWEMEHIAHKRSVNLSGGQRRLLQLAVAMAASPPILILDEPTNDLAPQRRHRVWEVLREMNRERGTTIIFITHNALEAEKAVQRIGIMQDGKLDLIGRPNELKKQIDQRLRLELFYSPNVLPTFEQLPQMEIIEAGHGVMHLNRDQVSDALAQVKGQGNIIDDFRLSSATLEDLFIHYVTQKRSK